MGPVLQNLPRRADNHDMWMTLGLSMALVTGLACAGRTWARRGRADLMSDEWMAGHTIGEEAT